MTLKGLPAAGVNRPNSCLSSPDISLSQLVIRYNEIQTTRLASESRLESWRRSRPRVRQGNRQSLLSPFALVPSPRLVLLQAAKHSAPPKTNQRIPGRRRVRCKVPDVSLRLLWWPRRLSSRRRRTPGGGGAAGGLAGASTPADKVSRPPGRG